MRFVSILCCASLVSAEEEQDATYLLQSQVLRASVAAHSNWSSCGGSIGDNVDGATISGGNPYTAAHDSCSCKSACDARSDCVGWSFTANCPGFHVNGCFLRGQWLRTVRNCGGSGYCESQKKVVSACGGVEGENRHGATVSGGNPAPNIADSCSCKAACDARSDCAGWTFTSGVSGFTSNGCFLRREWGAATRNCGNGFCASQKKAVSACGGVEGENRHGATISGGNPAPNVGDSCSCKAACDARSDCVGWTFTSGVSGFTSNGCFLRGQWGAATRNCGNGFCASARKEVTSTTNSSQCPNGAGWNCPFNDLSGMPLRNLGSAGACCNACYGRQDCNGYAYNTKDECWLKNGCQEPRTRASDVLSAGPIKRLNHKGLFCPAIKGLNCPGGDLRKDHASTTEECCDKCYAASGCGGYVFNTKGECWLKRERQCDNPTRGAGDVIAAGPIDRPILPPAPPTVYDYRCPAQVGLNCPFNDLSKTTANSAGECCDKCHANTACAGYVFNTKKECWLKKACQEPNTRAADVISAGPIYRKGNSSGGMCPNTQGLNCPGNDLPGMPIASGNAGACCDLCHGNPKCNGFYYETPDRCWLKNACQNPVTGHSQALVAGPIKRLNHKGLYCPAIQGLNCPFNDVRKDYANTTEECCDKCYAESACGGYVFNNKGECWLKKVRGCDNPTRGAGDVIAAGPIDRPASWYTPPSPPPPYCPGAQPKCAGVSCVDGNWVCGGGGFQPTGKWTEKCNYYIAENHGKNLDTECYKTLDEAKVKCEAAGDCFGISSQSNLGNGCYGVTHGGPTVLSWPASHAKTLNMCAWLLETTTTTTRGGGCSGAQPKCAGVACVDGTWVCNWHSTPPPGGCSGPEPKCAGIACVDGVWTCGYTEPGGTDSPGGDTEVTDTDCFDAEKGFGPGFSCSNTEMYCSADSGDGLTVGACCPTKCKKEFENKKKNNRAEDQRKTEAERKVKRNQNERGRKKAEKGRKKARKEKEWNNKRDEKENKNKNEESERKNKRGWKENLRKKERTWKQNKEARRKEANKRAEKRNKNAKPTPTTPKPRKPRKDKKKKKCLKKKKNFERCAAKKGCEKGQKKKGNKPPKC